MKLTNGLLALGLAALPASALALDDSNTFGPGVLRDDADDHGDAGELVKKLGDKDYKVRRDAFKKLEAMGDSARAQLEAAAKGDDAEIRWNASRLLDRLEDDGAAQPMKARVVRGPAGLKVRVGADAGDDDESDDGAAAGAAPRLRWRVLGSDELQQQMRELERRMQEFEKQFEDGGTSIFKMPTFGFRMQENPFGGFGRGGELQLGPNSSFQRSTTNDGKTESLTIKVDSDGRVHAEQTVDGTTTKFEADSFEQFQKDHPELLRSGPAVIAIRPGGQGRVQFKAPDADEAQDAKPRRKVKVKAPVETPEKQAKVRDADETGEMKAEHKPVLGVELAPVPNEVTEFLGLGGGALQIARVMEDMPAAKRGLKQRDILLEVDGKEVHVFEDVVRALEGADPNKVPLVVLRKGEKKKL